MKKVAIYHFTNESYKRPIIYQKTIEDLKAYAEKNNWEVAQVYLDFSLRKCDHQRFQLLLSEIDQYDILLVKNFYHISRNAQICLKILTDLSQKGIEVYSLENGLFSCEQFIPSTPLRVATYTWRKNNSPKLVTLTELENEIMNTFVSQKTNWEVVDSYNDISSIQNDSGQKEFQKLIKNIDKYDLLLVSKLNHIHPMAGKLFSRKKELSLDIYSLQEGYFKNNQEDSL